MKKLIIIVLAFLSFTGYAQQSTNDLKVSLQEAIDLGLKNRYDVQADKYDLAIADNEIGESKKEWIPEISGTRAYLQRYPRTRWWWRSTVAASRILPSNSPRASNTGVDAGRTSPS